MLTASVVEGGISDISTYIYPCCQVRDMSHEARCKDEIHYYVNSAKKETSSDFQLFFLSVNLMFVYICMNTKRVNTIRHKLKMFHRHVTNRRE